MATLGDLLLASDECIAVINSVAPKKFIETVFATGSAEPALAITASTMPPAASIAFLAAS